MLKINSMMLTNEVIGSSQGSSVLPPQNLTKTTSCQCWKELTQQEETSIETNETPIDAYDIIEVIKIQWQVYVDGDGKAMKQK